MINRVTNYLKSNYFIKDLMAGITIAALTIPTSMGYAQIAGLPPVYGLYAAIFPVIFFALFASSKQVIVGIDASSSAIVGSLLVTAGIMANTPEALIFIPTATFFTGIFMLLFSLADVRRLIVYVSEPVMGGTICGIALSVALSQIPKLADVSAQGNNSLQKFFYLFSHLDEINWAALALGLTAFALILLGKRIFPKIPAPLVILVIFTLVSALFKLDQSGLVVVGEIPQGLPPFEFPQLLSSKSLFLSVLGGLLIAIILTTDSLLTSLKFSEQNNEVLNEKKELFAFGLANLVSSFTGGVPINASVSRTAANQQFKGKTQVVSLVAAGVISLILIFFSSFLFYMPQAVLSAIVFSAVLGVVLTEFSVLRSLAKDSKRESIIWLVAMITVLLSGVLLGLLLGIALSFVLIIVARSANFSAFLGKEPEGERYIDIQRNTQAEEIPEIAIYRYSNALFFLNISQLIIELDKKISETPSIHTVIIESYAITTIDSTAAKKLRGFLKKLAREEIDYYFVNTIGSFRDSIKQHQLDDILTDTVLLTSIDAGVRLAQEKANIRAIAAEIVPQLEQDELPLE